MTQRTRFIFFLALPLLLGACTTLRYSDYGQVILVRSQPPGLEVWHDGENLGRTPRFVRVRRSHGDHLELRSASGSRFHVPLESEYRWKRSFFSDIIFLPYAPVAWLTDYATGTAWRYKTLPVLKFEAPSQPPLERAARAAVAPPSGDNEFISDELGGILAHRLEGDPYPHTLNVFLAYQYDHDSHPYFDDLPKIYYQLQNRGDTQLAETRVNVSGKTIELKGGLRDLYSGQIVRPIDMKLPSENLKSITEYGWRERVNNLFYFFPNDVSLDIANSNTELSLQNGEVANGQTQAVDDFWGQAARYFGAIGISRIDPPTEHSVWRFRTKFVPHLSLGYSRMKFSFAPIEDESFTRFHFTVGYGPTFSYGSKYGSVDLDLFPALVWTDVRWKQNELEKAANGGRVSLGVEFGYTYFVTDTWNVRAFIRTIEEKEDVWQNAFDSVAPGQLTVDNASYTYGGISIGYRFPMGRHPLRKWFREDAP